MMTRDEIRGLARELCSRYGHAVYIHTDASTGYNLRFFTPIEQARRTTEPCGFLPMTLEKYELVEGYPERKPCDK